MAREHDLKAGDLAGFSLSYGFLALGMFLRLAWPAVLLLLLGGLLDSWSAMKLMDEGLETSIALESSVLGDTVGGGTMTTGHDTSGPQAISGLVQIIGFILMVPATVRAMTVAAKIEKPPGGFLYWRWGGREWCYLFMSIFWILWIMLVVLICFAPAFVIAGMTGGGGLTTTTYTEDFYWSASSFLDLTQSHPAVLVALALGTVVAIWALVRSSLLPGVAAIENRFAPFYAFGLTAGAFWTLFLAALFVMLLVLIVMIPLGLILGLFQAGTFMAAGMGPSGALSVITWGVLGISVLVNIAANLYLTVVSCGASGYAWAKLVPERVPTAEEVIRGGGGD